MRHTKIIHVDYGTKGNSGFYLAQLLTAYKGSIPIDAYVHLEFPKPDTNARVIRLFGRFTKYIPSGRLRQLYKCLDLYICFAWIIYILRRSEETQRPIVFVQFFQSFHAYKWLFSRIRPYCTLVVTVHDAVELEHSYPAIIMSSRDEILKCAHILLVHGSESINKLSYLGKPIVDIPFPLMTSEVSFKISKVSIGKIVKFLFIGHIRPEKGVDVLIEAWRRIPEEILERATLTIAGTYNQSMGIDFSGLRNCTLMLEYLDDQQFEELIRDCHYVVMPYRGGTNSGVLSIAAAFGRPCITTRIPVFLSSPFNEEQLSVGDLSDFPNLLMKVILSHSDSYQHYLNRNRLRCIEFESNFSRKIQKVYDELIN